MNHPINGLTRRGFIAGAAALAGTSVIPASSAQAAAQFRRYNVKSQAGQKMLASYAKGVRAMLALPPDNPHNWFRNAFIHLMDCPHGNWWFYVWHRGYLGYFEKAIRELSGDPTFTMPYWDWTTSPQLPDGMFDGVLTPTDAAYAPYTTDTGVFTSFIQKPLKTLWGTLSAAQTAQLNSRGYTSFDLMWNDVIGKTRFPCAQKDAPDLFIDVSENQCFAVNSIARYPTRQKPALDEPTTMDVDPRVIEFGLWPTKFYATFTILGFNSTKSASHNSTPGGHETFSTLEALPHNIVHNFIGGMGNTDPGPYGNMTNFLSPVDPIFFLHHANMDRLWDVWTRKQQAIGLPYLPVGDDLKLYSNEPFLFYVDEKGSPVPTGKAGDYVSMDAFGYDYDPGFGENLVGSAKPGETSGAGMQATVTANTAQVNVPRAAIKKHLEAVSSQAMYATIQLQRPASGSVRQFDVLVNAPEGATRASAGKGSYVATIAFFGSPMAGMSMAQQVVVHVPLPKTLQVFSALTASPNTTLNIQVVPSYGPAGAKPAVKALTIRTQ